MSDPSPIVCASALEIGDAVLSALGKSADRVTFDAYYRGSYTEVFISSFSPVSAGFGAQKSPSNGGSTLAKEAEQPQATECNARSDPGRNAQNRQASEQCLCGVGSH